MRNAGVTVENLVNYVQLFQQGDETIEVRKEILREQREQIAAQIAELQQTLAMLDLKLEVYDKCILKIERDLI
jgi:DNA-binding transcriptional MerR regulator